MTREQKYRAQMEALGIYDPIFDPEITTLCQLEREHQRAKKAWSATALPAGSAPSFLDPHYAVVQRLRQEILQHREALGLTPKALRKLRGAAPEGPNQQELITAKLDLIAQRVSEYDAGSDPDYGEKLEDVRAYLSNPEGYVSISADKPGRDPDPQPYAGIPEAAEASRISDRIDAELAHAVAEDMG